MSSRQRRILIFTPGVVCLILIGALTYGFSLRLPFFADDLSHYPWLEGRGVATIWRSARDLGYYRPLLLTVWQAFRALQGRYDPLTLHALNLAIHLLNTLLVLGLVARLGRQRNLLLGLATALLFLLYPFSYQVVPWIGALPHLLVTTLILSSLLLFRLGPGQGSRLSLAASVALALLAPFVHETGILIAPLLLLLLLADEQHEPWPIVLRRTIPYWVCILIWLLAPRGGPSGGFFDLETRWQNGAYLSQGLVYPVAPLALRLLRITGRLDPFQATALVSGIAIVGWSLLLCKIRRGRLTLVALGWFALTAAPAWAMLPAEYVAAGARLLYGPAVGAALFWSIPVDVRWTGRSRLVGPALAIIVVLGAAAGGYRFIRSRVPLYEQARLAATQLVDARPHDPAAPLLTVNYPMWFAMHQRTYAIGHDGVVLVPDFVSVSDLMWLHTGQKRQVTSVVFADLLPEGDWKYIFPCVGRWVDGDSIQGDVRQAGKVMVTHYGQEQLAVYDAGGLVSENQKRDQDHLAAFGEEIALLSVAWEHQDSILRAELYWQCWADLEQETTVFLHLYDEENKLVAQSDGYPVMGTSRPVAWRPGDVWRDVRVTHLPDDLLAGRYVLKAGLYPVLGGPRLNAVGPAGEGFADEAVPIATLTLH
jgi:hypothetical protein